MSDLITTQLETLHLLNRTISGFQISGQSNTRTLYLISENTIADALLNGRFNKPML